MMLVKYLRWPNRSPYACIVAVKQENDAVRVGWSLCHPKDRFNKKLARQIAYNRAVNGWNSQPASRPTYENENTEQLINLEMQHMLLRAERYFDNEKPVEKKSLLSRALSLLM